MKIIWKITETIIVLPLITIIALFVASLVFIYVTVDVIMAVMCDIWGRYYA